MAGRPQAEREQRRALEIGAVLTQGTVPAQRAAPPLRLATTSVVRVPRTRDRRGRGMRGPAILPEGARGSRAADLAGAVRRAGARRRDRHRPALVGPPGARGVRRRGRSPDPRRLGERQRPAVVSWCAARGPTATRLVLFRRPIEHRCETRADLEAMVLTVLVEQVAELLGIDAEEVDPRYHRRED